jgi:hypothetical protein
MFLVVAPQDEIEIVLQPDEYGGASLWFFAPEEQKVPLFSQPWNPVRSVKKLANSVRTLWGGNRSDDDDVRVDLPSGSKVLEVNAMLAGDSRESRYGLRISALGKRPVPIGEQGNPGSLTATKP